MSIESPSSNWQPSDDLPDRLGGPPTFSMPDPSDLTGSTPWERAQTETDKGGPINDAERMVYLSDGESEHRVTWALKGRTLLADCSCKGHRFNDWCAHVASLWWQWTRGRIMVSHLDTGRQYPHPPAWLSIDDDPDRYDDLTSAELDAYLTCELGAMGNREYADISGRSAGTIGNLLGRARDKLGGVDR